MSHGDYNCCAVCDSKLEYSAGTANTKARICDACLVRLRDCGLNILTTGELIEWLKTTDKLTLKIALKKIGFSFCYYENLVDDALLERGLDDIVAGRPQQPALEEKVKNGNPND